MATNQNKKQGFFLSLCHLPAGIISGDEGFVSDNSKDVDHIHCVNESEENDVNSRKKKKC